MKLMLAASRLQADANITWLEGVRIARLPKGQQLHAISRRLSS